MAKMIRSAIPNVGEYVKQLELSYSGSWDMKLCDYFGKYFGSF